MRSTPRPPQAAWSCKCSAVLPNLNAQWSVNGPAPGFHLGRSLCGSQNMHDRLWGRGSMKLELPYKEGYDIVPAWKLSLRSQRILSMEALLLPPLVMELRPKPTR